MSTNIEIYLRKGKYMTDAVLVSYTHLQVKHNVCGCSEEDKRNI